MRRDLPQHALEGIRLPRVVLYEQQTGGGRCHRHHFLTQICEGGRRELLRVTPRSLRSLGQSSEFHGCRRLACRPFDDQSVELRTADLSETEMKSRFRHELSEGQRSSDLEEERVDSPRRWTVAVYLAGGENVSREMIPALHDMRDAALENRHSLRLLAQFEPDSKPRSEE